MKKLLAILLILVPLYAYSLEVSGIDGGGNADTLNGQNADFYLDNANHTGDITSDIESLTVLNQVAFSGDTTVFGDYSAINNKYIIFGHASTAAFPINLDNIANYEDGQQIRISKIDASTNAITITPAPGETIGQDATVVFSGEGEALTLHNNGGTDWKVLQKAVASEVGSALLHADNEDGILYNLSTIFTGFTSFDSLLTSSAVEANLATSSITVNASGRYDIFTHMVGEALSGTLIEIGTFLNVTTEIDETGSVTPAGAQHFAAFLNISTGTLISGNVGDLRAAEGNLLILAEVNGATPGAVYTFRFDNVIAPDEFCWIESAYDGSGGHNNKVSVLNTALGTYTAVTANVSDLPSTGATLADVYTRDFEFPDPKTDYVNGVGEVFVRITHVSTGSPGDQYLIDKISVSDAFSTSSPSTATFADLVVGDTITLKIKDGLQGVYKIRHGGLKIHRVGD